MIRNTELFNSFIRNYWKYYIELEKEFQLVSRYVEFTEDNFSTYSVEFLKLYQAVCSEIDVIGKMMASQINNSFNPEDKSNSIYKWWYEIQDSFTYTEEYNDAVKTDSSIERKKIQEVECCFLDTYKIAPWKKFRTETYVAKDKSHRFRLKDKSSIPSWWSDYNKVKHNRTSAVDGDSSKINYSKANLKNVSYAFTALYVLEVSFMEAVGTQNDLEAFADFSRLFVKEARITTEEIDNFLGVF